MLVLSILHMFCINLGFKLIEPCTFDTALRSSCDRPKGEGGLATRTWTCRAGGREQNYRRSLQDKAASSQAGTFLLREMGVACNCVNSEEDAAAR